MDRIAKFLDQGVTGVTNKVANTVSTIKRDFSRRSKRLKQQKKEKKLKKQNEDSKNSVVDDVEHKYKLVCNQPNCPYHPKPHAYEDFLNNLWIPKSNRASIQSSQIIISNEDKKLSLSNEKNSTDEKFLIENKLDIVKDRLIKLNHNQDDKLSTSSTDNSSDLDDVLSEKNIKLTITDENGETMTVSGGNLNNGLYYGICTICFNLLKSPLEIMPCSHIFHKNCISQWLEIKSTCPLCNYSTNKFPTENYARRWSDYNVRIEC